MSGDFSTLLTITYAIITVGVVISVILIIIRNIKNQFNNTLDNLERNKNLIISGSILSELNKVESLINNKELESKFNYWKSIFKELKDKDVIHISDELIEAEEKVNKKKYKEANEYLANVEFDIYIAKSKASKLLEDIQEITLSEKKNREIVTKLKSEYRNIFLHYNNGNNKDDYSLIEVPLELQFENVDKLFSAFEIGMENNV